MPTIRVTQNRGRGPARLLGCLDFLRCTWVFGYRGVEVHAECTRCTREIANLWKLYSGSEVCANRPTMQILRNNFVESFAWYTLACQFRAKNYRTCVIVRLCLVREGWHLLLKFEISDLRNVFDVLHITDAGYFEIDLLPMYPDLKVKIQN